MRRGYGKDRTDRHEKYHSQNLRFQEGSDPKFQVCEIRHQDVQLGECAEIGNQSQGGYEYGYRESA